MNFIKSFLFSIALLMVSSTSFSQCFQIESILADACDNGDEGFNEMFRMRIGASPLNTSTLSINWPAQSWNGLVQNATTALKVSQLNTAIVAAGGCGRILEPIGGILPANATVIVVTSQNLDTSLNSFGALTSDIYMLFQSNSSTVGGHFANYNGSTGTRTLIVNFGGGCSDSVTYQRANLVTSMGVVGEENGATINFTPSGTATYVNNGCIAPIPPFTVEAGTTPIAACAGQTINLSGTAQGQTSVSWNSASGSFSAPNNLSTSYTIPTSATAGSSITLTLSATNSCGATISDQIIITISSSTLILDSANNDQNICSGSAMAPIQYTFGGGATGVTVTGFPTGVTTSVSGNIVTISGTPTSSFSYTINTNGGCGTVFLGGTITLLANTTLTLDTANNSQNICTGSAIAPIQYTFGGSATGVIVTGLPTGVSASTSGNIVTISGTPASAFSYTIRTDGGCGTVTLNGSVTLLANATLTLDTANNSQNICSGSPIAPIQYTFGGSATGAVVTGLPTGVSASISGNIVTISGTPASAFSYTIRTDGGCGTVTLNGSATLLATATLTLDTANNSQNICSENPIAPIQYTFGGSATGVVVTGLPTGVSAATSGNIVTISGTPASAFSYTIRTDGGCGTVTLNGSVTLLANATLTLDTANNSQNICSGSPIAPIQFTFGGSATGVVVTGLPTGVSAATSGNIVTISGTPASAFSYTIQTDGGCGTVTLGGNVALVTSTITPTFDPIPPVCEGTLNSPLSTTSTNGITGVWSPIFDNTSTQNYTFTPNPGQCASTANVTVQITPRPILSYTVTNTICDGSTLNFSLNSNLANTTYIWNASVSNISGFYNTTITGSESDINNIATLSNPEAIGTITFTITPRANGCDGATTTVVITVIPVPLPRLTNGSLCVTATGEVYQTYLLNTGLDDADYDFSWFDGSGNLIAGATNSTLVVTATGTYSVIATHLLTGCTSNPNLPSATAIVTSTLPSTLITVIESNYFSNNATITVNVSGGTGTLMYSLDDGPLQSSNVFSGVSIGEHIVVVTDTEGCTYLTQNANIIDYPKYFTPNGDGINDTWNIYGLNQMEAKLYIFDRYGKLLKQLRATDTSAGWDGTFNQELLPSTDYWFTLEYSENGIQKTFKSHFSLMR